MRPAENSEAGDDTFGMDVDYAMLVKVYSSSGQADTRYSPGEIVDVRTIPITGNLNPRLISTSHIERQNLTVRMQLRRFTRLTNSVQQETRQLEGRLCATLRALQLLPGAFESEGYSCDGSRGDGVGMGVEGIGELGERIEIRNSDLLQEL